MRSILMFVMAIALLTCSGCIYTARYDGEYCGKVFDGETKAPIEGAVVLGTWDTGSLTPAGQVDYFYDARETLTDKNGEFCIPGMGLRVMSNLEPMRVMVFKSGFTPEESGLWESILTKEEYEKDYSYSKIIDKTSFPYMVKSLKVYLPYKDANGVANFPLRKMTVEERKKPSGPSWPSIPEDKMPLMMKEIDKDRVDQGMRPLFNKMR
jgi:hypothetical protein